ELLAQDRFPPSSLSCPGGHGDGGLAETAGAGGAPVAEAVTVLRTMGQMLVSF
ncbi:hypothetical protein DBR06_SOUSAS3210022, partial [Sousa chinensis]